MVTSLSESQPDLQLLNQRKTVRYLQTFNNCDQDFKLSLCENFRYDFNIMLPHNLLHLSLTMSLNLGFRNFDDLFRCVQ